MSSGNISAYGKWAGCYMTDVDGVSLEALPTSGKLRLMRGRKEMILYVFTLGLLDYFYISTNPHSPPINFAIGTTRAIVT